MMTKIKLNLLCTIDLMKILSGTFWDNDLHFKRKWNDESAHKHAYAQHELYYTQFSGEIYVYWMFILWITSHKCTQRKWNATEYYNAPILRFYLNLLL